MYLQNVDLFSLLHCINASEMRNIGLTSLSTPSRIHATFYVRFCSVVSNYISEIALTKLPDTGWPLVAPISRMNTKTEIYEMAQRFQQFFVINMQNVHISMQNVYLGPEVQNIAW